MFLPPLLVGLFALSAAAASVLPSAPPRAAYVVADASSPYGVRAQEGPPPVSGALSWGSYDEGAYYRSGWAVLDIVANVSEQNSTLSAYSAGFLEGFLVNMTLFLNNTGAWAPNSPRLQRFLDENYAWMERQIAQESGSDPYWAHVGAVLAQVRGLADGHASSGGAAPWRVVYQNIVSSGDLGDLVPLFGASAEQEAACPAAARRSRGSGGGSGAGANPPHKPSDHCSALVKLTPGYADIAVAHATWAGLENLFRILKRYDLPLAGVSGAPVPGRHVALSSFPGLLQYSSDDFYMLSSGLITTETTIDCVNLTLAREFITPESVLEWLRNVVANRLATDGASWASTFSRFASGTYTNQWLLLDTNRFVPGTKPPPGTLTVLEEMPGHIAVHDRTPELCGEGAVDAWGGLTGWASYNVVSDPFLFELSGAQGLVDKYGGADGPGAYYTWLNTSRANVFRRDAHAVVDAPTMQAQIRYNEYTTDPLATLACGSHPPYSSTNQIADRSDLNIQGGDYAVPDVGWGDSAGIDAKVTLVSWMRGGDYQNGVFPFVAQSGPTVSASCPPFAFSNSTVKVRHDGYVDLFDFPFVSSPFTDVAVGR